MTRRVVITGMGGVTAFGEDWQSVSRRLLAYDNAVRKMPEWQVYDGLHTLLGAPIDDFTLPEHYTRKRIRAMGRVSLMSTRATELALEQAGLIGEAVLTNGQTGIAYGSSTGSTGPVSEFATMLTEKHTHNITGTTYVQMMPHTTAVNTGLFFGLRGRVIPTSSACTSGSQAIGYAWEAIRHGYQTVMVAEQRSFVRQRRRCLTPYSRPASATMRRKPPLRHLIRSVMVWSLGKAQAP